MLRAPLGQRAQSNTSPSMTPSMGTYPWHVFCINQNVWSFYVYIFICVCAGSLPASSQPISSCSNDDRPVWWLASHRLATQRDKKNKIK